jgi:integrase
MRKNEMEGLPTKTEGEQFSLHTRPSKRGDVFYAQFRRDDGKWSTAKSTHVRIPKGKDGPRAMREALIRATAWAQAYVDGGQVVTRERATFAGFAAGFFDSEGQWAREKRRRGHRLSSDQCERHARSVKNHLEPFFGRMRIANIDDEQILRFQEKLENEGLAGGTINRVTVALRLVLKAAYRKKMMRRMPIVEAVSEKDHKRRGVYLPQEIRSLFKLEWPDRRCYIANLTAAATGMRAGEVVALRESDVLEEVLKVEHTWNPRFGLGPTKTGRVRIVPITSRVHDELAQLIRENPRQGENRFVFYSMKPDRPMDQREATEALYVALAEIGIDEKARKARGLDFHAWRHTFNSLLIDRRVPLQAVQSVTGHLTDEMTQRYYHLGGESGAGIRQIAESLFVEEKKPVGTGRKDKKVEAARKAPGK